jgi:hypothetical protein
MVQKKRVNKMYRISRNLEASLIDRITADLVTDNWVGIYVEKSSVEIYGGHHPAILVNVQEIRPEKLEIGSKTNLKYFIVYIRIFAQNDGQRLDLSDWLLDKFEDDTNYYIYTITNGVVSSKILTGRIVITKILENRKELTNTEMLEKEDRYRHLLSFECIVAD